MAHIHWDSRPLVSRIASWADNVARGKDDRRQSFTKAEFVAGGTIGPLLETQVVVCPKPKAGPFLETTDKAHSPKNSVSAPISPPEATV